MRHLVAAALMGAALLVACGSRSTPSAPAIPQDVVPGVVDRTEPLGEDDIANEALDPAGLTRLLDDAGFVVGAQRQFSPGPKVRRVDIRVLVFDSSSGAGAYLGWLDSHASDVIGNVDDRETLEVGGSTVTVFAHFPVGCCPKETPVYVAAWRDGRRILSVKAAGPGADLDSVRRLAAAVETGL